MGESVPPHRVSVHQLLGGGSVADLLLWKKWFGGIVLLISATTVWFLFERAGYNLLSFVANVLLLLVIILFFWAKSATLLNRYSVGGFFGRERDDFFIPNVDLYFSELKMLFDVDEKCNMLLSRPLPPLPDMEISEDAVVIVADVLRLWINHILVVAKEIAVNRNLKLFLQVAVVLWIASYVGSLFSFLTLVYIGVLLSLSVPVLYDKFQDHINDKLCLSHKIMREQYRKIDEIILKKIPAPSSKEKKTE